MTKLTIEDCKKELEFYIGENYINMTWIDIINVLNTKDFSIDITQSIQDILQAVKKKYKENGNG